MTKTQTSGVRISMFNKSLLTVAILSVLGVGCSSDNNDPDETVASTLAGSVAKGIVKDGTVTAFTLSPTGEQGAAVGTATTAADGSYTLTMSDSYDGSSPLLLELTPTDATTMVCDNRTGCGATADGDPIGFGDDIQLTADSAFKLSAVVPPVGTGAEISAAITAFTNIAASNVKASGAVTESSVLAANSQVSQLAGVNILSESPVDIADDEALSAGTPESQRYAIMLAAIANQVFADTGDDGVVTMEEAIANLDSISADFNDGIIGNDSGGLSPADFYETAASEIAAVSDKIDEETADDASQLVTAMSGQIEEDGSLTPQETTGENPTEVAQAKAFVTEVRTWADALQSLETPAETFLDEAGTIADTLDTNSGAVLEVYAMALGAAADAIGTAVDAGDDVPASVDVMDDGELVGTVNITDNSTDGSRAYALSGSDLAGVEMSADISMSDDPTDELVAAGDVVLAVDGSASNSDVTIGLTDAAFTVTLTEDLDLSSDDSEPSFGGVALVGMLSVESADGDSITAEADIKFVALDSSLGDSLDNDMNITLEKIALNNLSVTSDSGETAGLSVSFEVNDAASFDTLSYLNSKPEIYSEVDISQEDIDFSAAIEEYGYATLTNLSYHQFQSWSGGVLINSGYQTCTSGTNSDGYQLGYSCVEGDLIGLNDQIDLDSLYPQSYIQTRQIAYFDYAYGEIRYAEALITLDDMETAESFLDATLKISGNIDLAEHDEATLVITVNKTGIDAGKMNATLGYAGKSLQMDATTTNGDEDGTNASLSFSNADGVAMTVNSSDDWVSGNVTVGDEEVGTIADEDGLMIIRYNDGTFESL